MIQITNKQIGYGLISLAIVLIVMIALVKINFDDQAVLLCDAVAADPTIDMANCPVHNSSTPWLLLVEFTISLVIGLSGIFISVIPFKKIKKKIDFSRLDEAEKKIINIIKENDGSTYQSNIVKDTGFSKVKTTRILDRLEGKGIIQRQRRGMTNIIILK